MDKEQLRLKQRIDSKFTIVLQEFRVAQQGVQIFFAFLLTLPFQSKFQVNEYQKWIYAGALLSAMVSALFFIAPVSQHQILSGHGMKQTIVDAASNIGQVALAFLLASVVTSVFLVIDIVLNIWIAVPFSAVGLFIAGRYWYYRPIQWRKLKDDDE